MNSKTLFSLRGVALFVFCRRFVFYSKLDIKSIKSALSHHSCRYTYVTHIGYRSTSFVYYVSCTNSASWKKWASSKMLLIFWPPFWNMKKSRWRPHRSFRRTGTRRGFLTIKSETVDKNSFGFGGWNDKQHAQHIRILDHPVQSRIERK